MTGAEQAVVEAARRWRQENAHLMMRESEFALRAAVDMLDSDVRNKNWNTVMVE